MNATSRLSAIILLVINRMYCPHREILTADGIRKQNWKKTNLIISFSAWSMPRNVSRELHLEVYVHVLPIALVIWAEWSYPAVVTEHLFSEDRRLRLMSINKRSIQEKYSRENQKDKSAPKWPSVLWSLVKKPYALLGSDEGVSNEVRGQSQMLSAVLQIEQFVVKLSNSAAEFSSSNKRS